MINTKITMMALITSAFLIGCGGSSSKSEQDKNGTTQETQNEEAASEGEGSNIPYLRDNHTNYSQHGSTLTPAPTKDENKKSIDWTIAASSQEGAVKLAEHINFMTAKLEGGENPRAWDKLFLMEAFMKVNSFYTTSVERSGTNVVISKNANTSCAYSVISAHSDVVSGDFFGKGDITIDHSTIAENILASNICNEERSDIETYIISNQKSRT
jgi:hypothetical protein